MNFKFCLDSRYVYPILFFILGYFAFQYHCQHKILTNSVKNYNENIELYQNHLDGVMEHHTKAISICDSLMHVIDSLKHNNIHWR